MAKSSRDRSHTARRGRTRAEQAAAARAARRSAALFVGAFLFIVAVLGTLRAAGLEGPAAETVGRWTAATVYALLRFVEPGMHVAGNLLTTDQGVLRVAEECSGFELAGLLGAAMLAYPGPWRRRLAGVALLLPFVFLLNVVRVASLSLALEHAPASFEILHTVVWQGLLILAGLGFWLAWWGSEAVPS